MNVRKLRNQLTRAKRRVKTRERRYNLARTRVFAAIMAGNKGNMEYTNLERERSAYVDAAARREDLMVARAIIERLTSAQCTDQWV